jgi:hypothetical protein
MSERDQYQQLRAEFDAYDQAVDVVSCWESFTNATYASRFEELYFDRFPSITTDDDDDSQDITPDFTIYFNQDYSIVGEIKRTFPNDPKPFRRTVEQLTKYDCCPEVKANDGSYRSTAKTDILLLVSSTNANQIGTRIDKLRKTNEISFAENLVMLRYWFNQMDTVARYEFERVTQLSDEFRDDPIPDEIALSNEIGPEGDYGTMITPPKYFVPEKAKKPVCNDRPPGQYLATVLWHKIFPQYLSEDEYLQWQAGTAQKTMPIERTVDEIQSDLNQYLVDGYARRRWIRESLEFLATANLAEPIDDGFLIKFRGLVRRTGNDQQEGLEDVNRTSELADTFISRFVKYTDEEVETDEEDDLGQLSLDEF